MSTEIIKSNKTTDEINIIKTSWGEMGIQVSDVESSLTQRANNAIASLKTPVTFAEVQEAERVLEAAKKECNAICIARKAYTTRFEAVSKRLIEPEKILTSAIINNQPAIIKLKQQKETEDKLIENKNEEIARVKEWAANAITTWDATCKQTIVAKVNSIYEYALSEKGNIQLADLPDYISTALTRVKSQNLFVPIPLENHKCNYLSAVELLEAVVGLAFTPVADYEADFENALNDQFKDYDLAIKDKDNALRIADEQRKTANAEIDSNRAAATTMNTMVANAAVFNAAPISETKALKKSYVIDTDSMPETFENAVKILAAFLAAGQKAKEATTVKKWFGFSADHAGKALAKLKCEDNDFTPLGVIFKQVDKL